MRAGIDPDSQSRYASSLTAHYEFSSMVEQSPLYRRATSEGGKYALQKKGGTWVLPKTAVG
jgi:hypothetical protein